MGVQLKDKKGWRENAEKGERNSGKALRKLPHTKEVDSGDKKHLEKRTSIVMLEVFKKGNVFACYLCRK